jgi:hypothetical protein
MTRFETLLNPWVPSRQHWRQWLLFTKGICACVAPAQLGGLSGRCQGQVSQLGLDCSTWQSMDRIVKIIRVARITTTLVQSFGLDSRAFAPGNSSHFDVRLKRATSSDHQSTPLERSISESEIFRNTHKNHYNKVLGKLDLSGSVSIDWTVRYQGGVTPHSSVQRLLRWKTI